MAETLPARGARGSYASLICLHCRSRKIKCQLPDPDTVSPSDSPQPSVKSCQRCRNLGLECVVQRTILGRPAAKRKRPSETPSTQTGFTGPSPKDIEDDVKDLMITEVADHSTPSSRESHRPPPDTNEVFKSMVSAPHLTSVLLANDRRFGVSIPSPIVEMPKSLSKLVSSGMAALLDENLSWHRFHIPILPSLTKLRPQLASETRAFENKATKLLFALLALLAIDAPVNRLKDDQQLRHDLKTAVAHYGQAFLFDPPTHRHTIAALLLLTEYCPAALIATQTSACTAVKSQMYITLTYRIAEKLGINRSVDKLQDWLEGSLAPDQIDVDSICLDALTWTHIVVNDAFVDGFSGLRQEAKASVLGIIQRLLDTVEAVLKFRQPTIPIYYHFWYLKGTLTHMGAFLNIQTSEGLADLWHLMTTIESTISQQKRAMLEQVPTSSTEDEYEATVAAEIILGLHFDRLTVSNTGVITFAAMMHDTVKRADAGLKAEDAVQISEIVIKKLKDLQLGKLPEAAPFLGTFSHARHNRLQDLLEGLVHTAGSLTLSGVPYLPPTRAYAMLLLFHCKVMVEENAVRIKVSRALNPNVESQLSFLGECADKLDAMAITACRSAETAFADGDLNAASAKFVRCLRSILTEWKNHLATDQEPAEIFVPVASVEPLGSRDVFDDFQFDDLFTQWQNWPQAGLLDQSYLHKSGVGGW